MKDTGTQIPFVVVCSQNVSKQIRSKLSRYMGLYVFDEIEVNDEVLADNLNAYQKWNTTFFKLNIARLTQFSKIVLLDADMIIKENIDVLFECEHFSCVPAGKLIEGNDNPEYGLNSGLMVLEPSVEFFEQLVNSIDATKKSIGNRPIGDQDVFKYIFLDWINSKNLELPETYNCYSTYIDQLINRQLLQYDSIKVIHYAYGKPWNLEIKNILRLAFNAKIRKSSKYEFKAFVLWWKKYFRAIITIK